MSTGRRTLIIFMIVLVAALVAADRIGARVVAGQLATRAQRAESLTTRPDVTIGGVPFLTQVISGRYHDVQVTVHGFQPTQGPLIQTFHADLRGVHVPLGDAIRGDVRQVPVDRVTSTTHATFDDVNAYLTSQRSPIRISASGTALRVSLASAPNIASDVAVGVSGDFVTITPKVFLNLLTLRIPVQGLPFNVRLTSVRVRGDGLTITAGGDSVVLTNTPVPS